MSCIDPLLLSIPILVRHRLWSAHVLIHKPTNKHHSRCISLICRSIWWWGRSKIFVTVFPVQIAELPLILAYCQDSSYIPYAQEAVVAEYDGLITSNAIIILNNGDWPPDFFILAGICNSISRISVIMMFILASDRNTPARGADTLYVSCWHAVTFEFSSHGCGTAHLKFCKITCFDLVSINTKCSHVSVVSSSHTPKTAFGICSCVCVIVVARTT